jgi:uncharacterized protein with FMN-binding domain
LGGYVAATIAGRPDEPAAETDVVRPHQKSRMWLSMSGGIATVGVCVGAVLLVSPGESSATPSVQGPVVVVPAANVQGAGKATPSMSVYRDGRFTATGHYLTPGGNESIAVNIDIEADTVTASDIEVEATSPTARQFQEQFRNTIAGRVTARPLAGLSVSRVSGASLTSLGFNDALAKIRQEAKK